MRQKPRLDRIPLRGAKRLLKSILGRLALGEIRVKVRLENEGDRLRWKEGRLAEADIRVQEVEAVADTGAVMTVLPQDLVETLGLEIFGRVVVTLADDRKIELEKAGAISLTIAGRAMKTDCLVGPPGCDPLLGLVVMEELDLIADPARRTLTPRPESPYLPTLMLKAGRVGADAIAA